MDDLRLKAFLSIHLLQTPVFFLQFLHVLRHGGIHDAKLGALFVKRRVTLTVFTAEIQNFDASFGFFEDGQDLAVGKSGLLQVGSPCSSILENPTFERNYCQGRLLGVSRDHDNFATESSYHLLKGKEAAVTS